MSKFTYSIDAAKCLDMFMDALDADDAEKSIEFGKKLNTFLNLNIVPAGEPKIKMRDSEIKLYMDQLKGFVTYEIINNTNKKQFKTSLIEDIINFNEKYKENA